MNDNQPVFYQPGKPGIIDIAIMRDGESVLTSGYFHETLGQVRLRYPDAEAGELGPVVKATEAMFKRPPVEITSDRFHEMLEILPPEDWRTATNGTSFKLCEHTSGNITAIFVFTMGRYFEMQDSAFMTHADIIAAVNERFAPGVLHA